MCKNVFGQHNFLESNKFSGSKFLWGQILRDKKLFTKKLENFFWVHKNFVSKKMLGRKILGPKGLTRGEGRVMVVVGGEESVSVFVSNIRPIGFWWGSFLFLL